MMPASPWSSATTRPTARAATAATSARNAVRVVTAAPAAPPTAPSGRARAPARGRGLSPRQQQREQDEGQEPRDVEVRPVGERELEADEHGSAQRGELERALAQRDRRDDAGEREDADLEDHLHDVEVRDPARVVLAPVPRREGRVAVELVAERAVDEGVHRRRQARLEQQDREHGQRRERRTPIANFARAAGTEAVRIGEPERRQQQRGELRPAGERNRRTPRAGRGREPESPDEDRGHDRVVRVRSSSRRR